MKRIRHVVCRGVGVVLVLILLVEALPAQIGAGELRANPVGSADVQGIILQNDGVTPVGGLVVWLKNIRTNKIYKSEVASSEGYFVINNVPSGVYLLNVERPGETVREWYDSREMIVVDRKSIKQGKVEMIVTLSKFDLPRGKPIAERPEAEAAAQARGTSEGSNIPREKGKAFIGRVTAYDPTQKVAEVLIIQGFMYQGQRVEFKGARVKFTQTVTALTVKGNRVERAYVGDRVKVHVKYPVAVGDAVYALGKITPLALLFGEKAGEIVGLATVTAASTVVLMKFVSLLEVEPYASPHK